MEIPLKNTNLMGLNDLKMQRSILLKKMKSLLKSNDEPSEKRAKDIFNDTLLINKKIRDEESFLLNDALNTIS